MKKQVKIDINKELDSFADLAFLARLENQNPTKYGSILADKTLNEEKLAKIVASARSESEMSSNETDPITIEELLDAIEKGYVTELSSWDWEGKIYTSPDKYFLLKILDDEYCAIQKGTSSKWEIIEIKKLKNLF